MTVQVHGLPFTNVIAVGSVHVDRLGQTLAAVDAVIAVMPTGAVDEALSVRENAALDMVDAVHEHLRDGSDVIEMNVTLAARSEWDGKDGRHINGWTKRQEFRGLDRQLVGAITWMTDEGWAR